MTDGRELPMDKKALEIMWSNLINLILVAIAFFAIFLPIGLRLYGMFFENPNEQIIQNFDRFVDEMRFAASYVKDNEDVKSISFTVPVDTDIYNIGLGSRDAGLAACENNPCVCLMKVNSTRVEKCASFISGDTLRFEKTGDFNKNRDASEIYYAKITANRRPKDVDVIVRFLPRQKVITG